MTQPMTPRVSLRLAHPMYTPNSRLMRIRRFFVALMPLLFAACLDSTGPVQVSIETTTFAPGLEVDLAASTKTASGLYFRDVTVGTGESFAVGDSVGAYYVGHLSTGVPFDSLKAPATSLRFKIGRGDLIPGFEQGVLGMKVGGRRQLILPPWLAFGSRDFDVIPGNSVVVFMVDAEGKY